MTCKLVCVVAIATVAYGGLAHAAVLPISPNWPVSYGSTSPLDLSLSLWSLLFPELGLDAGLLSLKPDGKRCQDALWECGECCYPRCCCGSGSGCLGCCRGCPNCLGCNDLCVRGSGCNGPCGCGSGLSCLGCCGTGCNGLCGCGGLCSCSTGCGGLGGCNPGCNGLCGCNTGCNGLCSCSTGCGYGDGLCGCTGLCGCNSLCGYDTLCCCGTGPDCLSCYDPCSPCHCCCRASNLCSVKCPSFRRNKLCGSPQISRV